MGCGWRPEDRDQTVWSPAQNAVAKWAPRTPARGDWAARPVASGAWAYAGPDAASWRAQPFALMLEQGGFLELDDCGLLQLEDPR